MSRTLLTLHRATDRVRPVSVLQELLVPGDGVVPAHRRQQQLEPEQRHGDGDGSRRHRHPRPDRRRAAQQALLALLEFALHLWVEVRAGLASLMGDRVGITDDTYDPRGLSLPG